MLLCKKKGPGTTMEFAVALLEQLYGKEKADEVSGPLVMRSNHRDEYVITELNSVEWTASDSPKVNFLYSYPFYCTLHAVTLLYA